MAPLRVTVGDIAIMMPMMLSAMLLVLDCHMEEFCGGRLGLKETYQASLEEDNPLPIAM